MTRFRTRELLLIVVIVALALALFTQHRRALVTREEAVRAQEELLDREALLEEKLQKNEKERAWLTEELENIELELRELGYEWNRNPFEPRTRPIAELGPAFWPVIAKQTLTNFAPGHPPKRHPPRRNNAGRRPADSPRSESRRR